MKSVLQRVTDATVRGGDEVVGSIDRGLLVYLGVEKGDSEKDLDFLVRKIPKLRLFEDHDGKINLSLMDIGASLLVVSQFTLCANLNKGNRPSFDPAADPDFAKIMYERFVDLVRQQGISVANGTFGAHMKVSYTNEGPVTILLESPKKQVDADK